MGRFQIIGRRQAGFGLVETLVVLSLCAFGMLGAIALLTTSVRTSRDAMHRMMAVTLVADLAERIRANRAAGIAYELPSETLLELPGSACDIVVTCAPAARAARDLQEWQHTVVAALPGARTSVTVLPVDGTSSLAFTIEVRWTAGGEPGANAFVIRLLA